MIMRKLKANFETAAEGDAVGLSAKDREGKALEMNLKLIFVNES